MKCAVAQISERGPPSPQEPTSAGEGAERNERQSKEGFRAACGKPCVHGSGVLQKLTRALLPALLFFAFGAVGA